MSVILVMLAGSLLLTLALELAFALVWRVPRRDLGLVALANLLTNPVVVLCHAMVPWPAATLLLEIAAAVTEGWLFAARGTMRRPWLFAVCANLLSFAIGLLL